MVLIDSIDRYEDCEDNSYFVVKTNSTSPDDGWNSWNNFLNKYMSGNDFNNFNSQKKKTEMVLPKIIHETKNDVYVAKFPDGTKEVDILKPNHGDEYDLEKGLLYYVIKHNLDLGKVLEWMRPILDETKRPENIEKHNKKLEAKVNKWFMEKSDKPIDDKECQKIIDNKVFNIDSLKYEIEVSIKDGGIIGIYDKEEEDFVDMIKPGFPRKGFLRHLIYKLYDEGHTTLEYFQLKKLTYRFYKGCFDSVEKECKSEKHW